MGVGSFVLFLFFVFYFLSFLDLMVIFIASVFIMSKHNPKS